MTLSGWESASEPFLEIAQSLCVRHVGFEFDREYIAFINTR